MPTEYEEKIWRHVHMYADQRAYWWIYNTYFMTWCQLLSVFVVIGEHQMHFFLFEWLCMGKRIVQLKIETNLWSARASDFQNAGFLLGNFLKYSHPKSNNTVCMYSYKCDLHYIYDLGWDMLTKGLSAQPFLFPSFFSWNLPFIIAFFTIAFFYASLAVESSRTPLTTILDYTR